MAERWNRFSRVRSSVSVRRSTLGFYYDIDLGDHNLDAGDLARIEKKMGKLASGDSTYTRETIPWADAVRYFEKKGDQYKLELLEGLKDEEITFYHHGGFTDLCAGLIFPRQDASRPSSF